MEREGFNQRVNKRMEEREEEIMTVVARRVNGVLVRLNTQMMKREDEVKGLIYRLE